MGIEYELLDVTNRRAFILGKGWWWNDLYGADTLMPGTATDVRARLPDTAAFLLATDVPERIVRFCEGAAWSVVLWNDWAGENDEIEAACTVVDSRYPEDDVAEINRERAERRREEGDRG